MDFNKNFSNKKILLISPTFYDYSNIIKNELECLGAEVFYFDERPSNNLFFKSALRFGFDFFIKNKIYKYYSNLKLNCSNTDITDVFVINAEAISPNIMAMLRTRYNDAKFTLYMWDSIKNKKRTPKILNFFDNKFSFDMNDCNKESGFVFEPLFYNKTYDSTNHMIKYDVSFVGSIHSDRLKVINTIREGNDLSCYFFLFSPSKLFSILKLISFKMLTLNGYAYISHHKIDSNSVSEILAKSKCIVDIHHPDQSGLTMRSYEVLGAGKKIITTNKNIKNHDIYNSNNVYIMDRESIDIKSLQEFIFRDFDFSMSEIIEEHRIDNWLKRIFK